MRRKLGKGRKWGRELGWEGIKGGSWAGVAWKWGRELEAADGGERKWGREGGNWGRGVNWGRKLGGEVAEMGAGIGEGGN